MTTLLKKTGPLGTLLSQKLAITQQREGAEPRESHPAPMTQFGLAKDTTWV